MNGKPSQRSYRVQLDRHHKKIAPRRMEYYSFKATTYSKIALGQILTDFNIKLN